MDLHMGSVIFLTVMAVHTKAGLNQGNGQVKVYSCSL